MRRFIAAVLVLVVCAPMVVARQWTDSTGKHKTEAEFIDLKDGKVALKKTDGTIIKVPIERLSPESQRYARGHSTGGGGKPSQRQEPLEDNRAPSANADMVLGPWKMRIVGFKTVPSYAWKSPTNSGTFTPTPPNDKIALVTIKGEAIRALTNPEQMRIQENLSRGGGDLGKLAAILQNVYKSKAFLSNRFFALVPIEGAKDTSSSACCWVESKSGLVESTVFDKSGKPKSYFGFASGAFEAILVFVHKSSTAPLLLVFSPFGDEQGAMGARIQTDAHDQLSVRYGTIKELRHRSESGK